MKKEKELGAYEKYRAIKKRERNSVLIRVVGPVLVLLFFVMFTNGTIVRDLIRRGSVMVDSHRIYQSLSSDIPNMVDERVELLSLLFRLARRIEFNDPDTDYQYILNMNFPQFARHEAVVYAQALPVSHDAVFNLAIHLEKNMFGTFSVTDMDSLLRDHRWTRESVEKFLPLLNRFYLDVNFASFYFRCIDFYRLETQRFIDEVYSHVNFDWFLPFSDSIEMRTIYSPSSTRHSYSAMLGDDIAYTMISGDGTALVQETVRNFANPIADRMYNENQLFRDWSANSLSSYLFPLLTTGEAMAREYVTRAYTVLYEEEHGRRSLPLLLTDKGRGFTYIEDVYSLISSHEIIERSSLELIRAITGQNTDIGQEVNLLITGREFSWHILDNTSINISEFIPVYVSVIYRTDTGNAILLDNSILLVDLGEDAFRRGYRRYARIPLS